MDDGVPPAVDDYLRARIKQHNIAGLGLAVVRRGQPLAKAYGTANLEWDVPATADTAFQLASVTKLLTGTLLMLLVQERSVRLDAAVGEYLPDAPVAWEAITLRQLASHASGLGDDVGTPGSVEEAVHAAFRQPLEYEPGAKVRYGLVDYVVLTHVLETVTGQSFPVLLRDRLTRPLGMTSTRFDNATEEGPIRTSDLVPRRSTVYNWTGDRQQVHSFLFPAWTYAAGGLHASVSDLARWAVALHDRELLTSDSLEQMWTPERLADGSSGAFGVGWIVDEHRGHRVTGHSGGPALADVVHFPDEDLTVAVLTNQQNLRPYLAMDVADLLIPTAQISRGRGL